MLKGKNYVYGEVIVILEGYRAMVIETVEQVLTVMREFCSGEMLDINKLDQTFHGYLENTREYKIQQADYLKKRGLNIIHFNRIRGWYYYLMTFLLQATESQEVYKELIRYCMKDQNITKENRFDLYYQLRRYNFLNSDIVDEEISDLCDDLYSSIYVAYKKELEGEYYFIPKEERNQNFVMVFISQVLGMEHGPTKTLLDRCYILEEYMGKKVFIVNTAELASGYCSIHSFNPSYGNYIEALKNESSLHYKNRDFAYFQCPHEMPDISVIREIMDVVKSEKPYFILTIGGNSIASDLCSNIIPTISISTVPSNRTMTYGQFQAMGRRIIDSDRKWIEKHNLPTDHIIESLFTSAFKEQTHLYTREQLGLPDNRFIVVLVGGRLDYEIDLNCMDVLYQLTGNGIFIVFLGKFDKYETYAEQNETFKINSINLGFQEDVLAVDECCDLYFNPKRVGGGTSVAEALYKGLPVVTLDYGDVGVGAGPDFHVKDYEEMYKKIIRYSQDKDFYEKMSKRARERAVELMDSKSEFFKIIKKAEESDAF